MSTRCRIGVESEDGTIESIYCHFDGYPRGVGRTLLTHYPTALDAVMLLSLGDLSICAGPLSTLAPTGTRYGDVVSYFRWRGEDVPASVSSSRHEYAVLGTASGADYLYLFGPQGWEYSDFDTDFRPLTEAETEGH